MTATDTELVACLLRYGHIDDVAGGVDDVDVPLWHLAIARAVEVLGALE